MQIDPATMPTAWLWAARGLALAVALWAARRVSWRQVLMQGGETHRFAASVVALILLWSLRAHVSDGPGLHILGVTTVTLLLGPDRALMATLLAQAVTSLTAEPGLAPAASWLVGSVLPVLTTEVVRRAVWRWLPHDPFSFIFGCAFLGAAVGTALAHMSSGLLLGSADTLWSGAVPSWLGFVLLVAFPEAFINGCVVTLLVVYWPEHLRGYSTGYETRRRL